VRAGLAKLSGMWQTLRSIKPAMLARLMVGSAMFLVSKTALTWLLGRLFDMPSWLNYLIVITSITIFGWLYHTKITFRTTLSWKTLGRYVQQAVALKVVDYAAYNLLVYWLGAGSVIAPAGAPHDDRCHDPRHDPHDARWNGK
jgi:hypothetical protein